MGQSRNQEVLSDVSGSWFWIEELKKEILRRLREYDQRQTDPVILEQMFQMSRDLNLVVKSTAFSFFTQQFLKNLIP
jgi:hypothetical protein